MLCRAKIGQKISFDIGRISTEHKVFDENGKAAGLIEFDLEKNESEGTKKLVALSGPLIDVLENSLILFIDEFDARLHPVISKQLISIFNNSPKNNNNAQLIVASHDTNLLDKDLLRRDQIWFTEKDIYGSSHLNSLLEYRVRNDASFEKDYISGKYGAIPLLGDSCMIFSESEHEE
ncbi:ATP-binding protein [Pseudomonas aeruginosa]|nr:ATP-binding protein [Pseudomonas aeruginosa]